MGIAEKYNHLVGWRTLASNVYQLTRETLTDPATYRMTVKAIDTNEPGANQKETGYFCVDYWGDPYSIIATGSTYVDVSDDFRTGKCPTSGKMAIIFESAFQGSSIYLPTASFQFLHPLALINIQKYNLSILWANKGDIGTLVYPTDFTTASVSHNFKNVYLEVPEGRSNLKVFRTNGFNVGDGRLKDEDALFTDLVVTASGFTLSIDPSEDLTGVQIYYSFNRKL